MLSGNSKTMFFKYHSGCVSWNLNCVYKSKDTINLFLFFWSSSLHNKSILQWAWFHLRVPHRLQITQSSLVYKATRRFALLKYKNILHACPHNKKIIIIIILQFYKKWRSAQILSIARDSSCSTNGSWVYSKVSIIFSYTTIYKSCNRKKIIKRNV